MPKHRHAVPTVMPVSLDVLRLSSHARVRGSQRCISPLQVELVLRYGRLQYGHDACHYFFGEREAARYRDELGSQVDRLVGIAVVVAHVNGNVITAYRNRGAWKVHSQEGRRSLATGHEGIGLI